MSRFPVPFGVIQSSVGSTARPSPQIGSAATGPGLLAGVPPELREHEFFKRMILESFKFEEETRELMAQQARERADKVRDTAELTKRITTMRGALEHLQAQVGTDPPELKVIHEQQIETIKSDIEIMRKELLGEHYSGPKE